MPNLFGTGANQVPLNSMLGSLAYQDADSINIGNISYSGTLTGGTGVVNIGSGQIYKDINGTVGVGGVPNVAYKLHVQTSGNCTVTSQGTTDASFLTNVNGTQGLYIHSTASMSEINELRNVPVNIVVNGSIRWTVDGSGNVGVGTTTPGAKFGVSDGSTSLLKVIPASSTVTLSSRDYADSGYTSAIYDATQHIFRVSGTEVFRLDTYPNPLFTGTGALRVPEGTTAQRPASPQEGMIRKNSTNSTIEGYNGSWTNLINGFLQKTVITTTSGVQTFTPNAKTRYLVVEMIGGGGAGGNVPSGSYSAGQCAAAENGQPGAGVRFIVPPSVLASTYYVSIGPGGAQSGTAGAAGGNGSPSHFSTSPTLASDFIRCAGGYGGAGMSSTVAPPHAGTNGTFGAVTITVNGAASSWSVLETTADYSTSSYVFKATSSGEQWSFPIGTNTIDVRSSMICFNRSGELYGSGNYGGRGIPGLVLQGNSGFNGACIIYEYS